MELYRFCVFSNSGCPPEFKPIQAETDAGARAIALQLLRNSPCIERMEVWRGADLAFRLNQHQRRLESPSRRDDV